MTTSEPNRLDRIEALLERSIIDSNQRQQEAEQRQRESEQRQLEAERQQQASNERLTRIEELIAQTMEITQATMQITRSNARSIEAMGTQFEETKRLADRVFQRMDSLTQQLSAIVGSRNEDRDFLRSIKAGIDKLLRRSDP